MIALALGGRAEIRLVWGPRLEDGPLTALVVHRLAEHSRGLCWSRVYFRPTARQQREGHPVVTYTDTRRGGTCVSEWTCTTCRQRMRVERSTLLYRPPASLAARLRARRVAQAAVSRVSRGRA